MKQQKNIVQISALLILIAVVSGALYLRVYRPRINYILTAREKMKTLKAQLSEVEKGAGNIVPLSEEELENLELIKERIVQKYPPPEFLPKYLTFQGSTNLFYGKGVSLQQQIPGLFCELAQAVFESKGTLLNVLNDDQESTLTIQLENSEEKDLKPITLQETKLILTFDGNFKQTADFLGRLQNLPRLTEVSGIVMKTDKGVLTTTVSIKTYHCKVI